MDKVILQLFLVRLRHKLNLIIFLQTIKLKLYSCMDDDMKRDIYSE